MYKCAVGNPHSCNCLVCPTQLLGLHAACLLPSSKAETAFVGGQKAAVSTLLYCTVIYMEVWTTDLSFTADSLKPKPVADTASFMPTGKRRPSATQIHPGRQRACFTRVLQAMADRRLDR